jgi:hypothetical protein
MSTVISWCEDFASEGSGIARTWSLSNSGCARPELFPGKRGAGCAYIGSVYNKAPTKTLVFEPARSRSGGRLAGCILISSVYNKRHRRRYAHYLLAEGQSLPSRVLSEGRFQPRVGRLYFFHHFYFGVFLNERSTEGRRG